MGGVEAFHQLRQRREGDRPDDTLFRYNHEPEFRELLKSLDLYTDPSSGLTRNTKSLRVTGINLRLLKNPRVPPQRFGEMESNNPRSDPALLRSSASRKKCCAGRGSTSVLEHAVGPFLIPTHRTRSPRPANTRNRYPIENKRFI